MCVWHEDAHGVGGKFGLITVAVMSHECRDERLCVAEVIQRALCFVMTP